MSVIVLSNLKGGVSKTTTAVHLARLVALRLPHLKPLLLDIDRANGTKAYKRHLSGVEVRAVEPFALAEIAAHSRRRAVVIDSPPSYLDACCAFDVANLILIPCVPEDAAVEATQALITDLGRDYPHVPVRVLISMHSRAADAPLAVASAQRRFKGRLLKTRISRSVVFRDARRAGKTVFDFMPDCMPSRQLNKLGDELGLKN